MDERRPAAVPADAPTLRESRDGWLRDGRRRQLSPDTRQSYRESTDEFLAVVGRQRTTDSLTAEDLDRYLVALNSASRARGPLSVATQGACIARVRAWLNCAWHEGDLMTALDGQLRPPSVPVTTPPPLPLGQIRSMLGRVNRRNQVLLLILLDTGLRIGDALRLRRTDLCHMQDGQPYFEVAISKTHTRWAGADFGNLRGDPPPLSSAGVPTAVDGGVGRPSLPSGGLCLLFDSPVGPPD